MQIQLDKQYLTGLSATTDLHAGGLFFCIIYNKCLQFHGVGRVTLSKKVVAAVRPMSPSEPKSIDKYTECQFRQIDLILTAESIDEAGTMLAFHAFDKRSSRLWGEAYKLHQN
jgi:hypothetical protein